MSKERLEEHTHIAVKIDEYRKLKEQAERVQELEEINRKLSSNKSMFIEELVREQQQNKRYRKALEFYANENNYEIWNSMALRGPEINRDKGYKARKALEEYK